MQTIARIYRPPLRKLEWPRISAPKLNIFEFFQAFSDAAELHRRALSAAYLTALYLDQPKEAFPMKIRRGEILTGDNPHRRDGA